MFPSQPVRLAGRAQSPRAWEQKPRSDTNRDSMPQLWRARHDGQPTDRMWETGCSAYAVLRRQRSCTQASTRHVQTSLRPQIRFAPVRLLRHRALQRLRFTIWLSARGLARSIDGLRIASNNEATFRRFRISHDTGRSCLWLSFLRALIWSCVRGVRRALAIEREHANALRESGIECYGGEQQPSNPKSKAERRAERSAKLKAARLAKKAEPSRIVHLPAHAELRMCA